MLRVTTYPKTKINLIKSHNDMGHLTPTSFGVSTKCWFWMSLNDYMEKKEFEKFDFDSLIKSLGKEQERELCEAIRCGKTSEFIDKINGNNIFSPFTSLGHLKRLLERSGGYLLWQFDAANPKFDGYVRSMVAMGSNDKNTTLRQLSLFEAKIQIPVYSFVCKVLNKCLYFYNKKEMTDWLSFKRRVKK